MQSIEGGLELLALYLGLGLGLATLGGLPLVPIVSPLRAFLYHRCPLVWVRSPVKKHRV